MAGSSVAGDKSAGRSEVSQNKQYCVYITGSSTGTLYVGMTGFLLTRAGQHKRKRIEGFSKKYGCTRLVYYESYDNVNKE